MISIALVLLAHVLDQFVDFRRGKRCSPNQHRLGLDAAPRRQGQHRWLPAAAAAAAVWVGGAVVLAQRERVGGGGAVALPRPGPQRLLALGQTPCTGCWRAGRVCGSRAVDAVGRPAPLARRGGSDDRARG